MKLADALSFVKKTVGDGDIFGSYHFLNGAVWSTNQRCAARCATDIKGEFTVPSRELEIAVARLPEAEVGLKEDALVLKQGRARATIPIRPFDRDTMAPVLETRGTRTDVTDEWKSVMSGLAEVVEDDPPAEWMASVMAFDECTAAIGYASSFFAVADVPLLDGREALLPSYAGRLLATMEQPARALVGEGFIAFIWEDGRVFRTQLLQGAAPKIVKKRLLDAKVGDKAWEITPEWRTAAKRMRQIVGEKGMILFSRDHMEVDLNQLHTEDDTDFPITKPSRMRGGVIGLIAEHATHIEIGADNIWRWGGKKLRGLAAPMVA